MSKELTKDGLRGDEPFIYDSAEMRTVGLREAVRIGRMTKEQAEKIWREWSARRKPDSELPTFSIEQDGATINIKASHFGSFFLTATSGAHQGECELTTANAIKLRDWLVVNVKD